MKNIVLPNSFQLLTLFFYYEQICTKCDIRTLWNTYPCMPWVKSCKALEGFCRVKKTEKLFVCSQFILEGSSLQWCLWKVIFNILHWHSTHFISFLVSFRPGEPRTKRGPIFTQCCHFLDQVNLNELRSPQNKLNSKNFGCLVHFCWKHTTVEKYSISKFSAFLRVMTRGGCLQRKQV